MVSDDLEFYHDQTGLSVGRAPFLASIKQNICGKVQRTLIENTLEVYPLNGYGAVEIGIHRFHHPNEPDNAGDAKFVHIWHNDNGVWKITRVIIGVFLMPALYVWMAREDDPLPEVEFRE